MIRRTANLTGRCWGGCGSAPNQFWCAGHDNNAKEYLIVYLLRELEHATPDSLREYETTRENDALANLLHTLGFTPVFEESVCGKVKEPRA